MIKPVKVVEQIASNTQKVVTAVTDAVSEKAPKMVENLPQASGELLQAYRGIKPGKLFQSFPEFVDNFKNRLAGFQDELPEALYRKLLTCFEGKDFSLTKTLSEYYSGLKKCTSLDDVRKMYPEIKLPDETPLQIITKGIKGVIGEKTCATLRSIADPEAQKKFFNTAFDDMMSEQIKKSDVYPEILKIRDSIREEILIGKFSGTPRNPLAKLEVAGRYFKYGNNPKVNILFRFLQTDYDAVMLDILRQNYIEGKNITEIVVKTPAYDFKANHVRGRHPFGILDKNLKRLLANTEKSAKEFEELKNLSKTEISSRVMTETWKTSGLRRDLGNETAYKKDWSLVKAVWQKTMFPETTYYPTEKLIDSYLLSMYQAGKRDVDAVNPLLKYLDNPNMDKTKISLLKWLYRGLRTIYMNKSVLSSQGFKDFKAKFDTDAMAKTLEGIEEHYKNAFFKRFWTDERKLRFTQALNQNREIAKENIELSDSILIDAMNKLYSTDIV